MPSWLTLAKLGSYRNIEGAFFTDKGVFPVDLRLCHRGVVSEVIFVVSSIVDLVEIYRRKNFA